MGPVAGHSPFRYRQIKHRRRVLRAVHIEVAVWIIKIERAINAAIYYLTD